MSDASGGRTALETSIPPVKGTLDRLPADHARLASLEALVLERFGLAGYERLSTPVLEPVDLHERKSGAGIVSKLFEVSGHSAARVCLRPELTAGIVRAYAAAEPAPALPWRVSHCGPTFRRESSNRSDRLREFHQIGVERLGDSGAIADAEVIALAFETLRQAGVRDPKVRIGHVGLILEMLGRSGLPPTAQGSLVEMLSEAAAEGGDVESLDRGLGHFAEWLGQVSEGAEVPLPIEATDDAGIDRLFRTLVPVVNGRRPGHEIIHRLRRKWDQGHDWLASLDRVRKLVRSLAELKGSLPDVLDRLRREFEAFAPDSVASLRSLLGALEDHGVSLDRVELDLGFSRGIGFYSQMIFEIVAPTPGGWIEVCGGGRYDGLARVFGSDRDDRGVGFAFGLERLDAVLEAQGHVRPTRSREALLIVPESPALWKNAALVASSIRDRGVRAVIEAGWTGGDLVERARSMGASRSLVVGGSSGEFTYVLHDHVRRIQRPIEFDELQRLIASLPSELVS